ncbi:basic blue protein-like [Oryza brachyantha]|uniref:Phytocyanin domain-containing protein n=1 Tax=Oryza brachyantha TaxID=4533 RepID=J3N0E2_ORYBR|nr:basic blue protein-like [Oryza brachyantha]
MASMGRVVVVAMTMMVMLGMASAATYNVGEPGGAWDLNTNYANWVAQKKFHPGDQIVFKYSPQQHDVVEVNKAGYDSCSSSSSSSSAIATHTTGNDAIALNSTGTRYFICGFPGHCTTTGTGSMKIQIDVVQADSSTPAPAPPTPSGSGPNPTPPAPVRSPPSSAATSLKATAAAAVAVLLAALMA